MAEQRDYYSCVLRGDNRLFCSFDVRGRRQFTDGQRWSSPNALGPRAFFATMTNPAYLSIDRLQSTDEGIYRCRVDFKNSPTRKQKMNLTIIGERIVSCLNSIAPATAQQLKPVLSIGREWRLIAGEQEAPPICKSLSQACNSTALNTAVQFVTRRV